MSQKNMYNDCLDEDKLIAFMDDQIGPDQYLIPKDIRIRRKSGNVSCYFVSSPWLIASTVLNCILIAVAVIGWVAHWRTPRINDDSCKSLFAAYSPLLEGVKYEWYSFPNKLGATSPYRGQPNDELERKWADIAKPIILSFPPDRLPEINKSITHNLQPWLPVRQIAIGGKGNGLYAEPEFAHQLHCLNVIRKYTYREDWDYSGELEWTAGPDRLRLHVDHCIEALRIALMCTADVTPILLSIDPAEPLGASPDFETLHRCRNINSLLDWATSEGLLFKLTNRTMSNKTFL